MRNLNRFLGTAMLAGVVLMVAACDHGGTGRPAFLTLAGGHGPVTLTGGNGDHIATAGRGTLRTADFELASGATTVVVHSGGIGGALYRITTPPGAGQIPAVAVTPDAHVIAQLAPSGVNGPSIVDVELSSAVSWTVHLDGGSTTAFVDMRAGGLGTLDFGAGVSRIDAYLPEPGGTTVVRQTGGSSEFVLHAPGGVPVRVGLTGGAGSAVIDGTAHSGIGGGTVFTPDGWDGATGRVDVQNTAGVSSFTLARY